MPINFTNFAYLPGRDHDHVDVARSLGEGINVGAQPVDIYQKQKKAALANILGAVSAKYAAPTAQAKIDSLGAQKQDYLAKALQAQVEAQMDPLRTQAYVNQANSAANLSNTRAQWVAPQAAAGIQARVAQALASQAAAGLDQAKTGVLPGTVVQDKNNPDVSYQNLSPKTIAAQQNAQALSLVGDYVSQNFAPTYLGTGATAQMLADRKLASKNDGSPEVVAAQHRLVHNAVAAALSQEAVVSTLGRIGSRVTDQTLKHMTDSVLLNSSPWLKNIVNNLPANLAPEAQRQFAEAQKEISAKRQLWESQKMPFNNKTGTPIIDLASAIKTILPKPDGLPAKSTDPMAMNMSVNDLFNLAGGN